MNTIFDGLEKEDYDLGEDQINFFILNGYLVIDSLFSDKECNAINELAEEQADENHSAILNPDRKFVEIRSVMKAKRIVNVLRKIMSGKPVGLMSQFLFKKPGSPYASQAWNPHQDNSYVQTPNGEYRTINIALKNQYINNGCMYIYPASHKDGIFPFAPTKSYREDPFSQPGNIIDDSILDKFMKTNLIIKKGGTLFLHGNCIHGSYPNESDKGRPLLSISYIPKGTFFLVGKNANRTEIDLD